MIFLLYSYGIEYMWKLQVKLNLNMFEMYGTYMEHICSIYNTNIIYSIPFLGDFFSLLLNIYIELTFNEKNFYQIFNNN